ncbi:MAG: hypothetical protein Q9164_003097 [Protoblastenia rupestris]
MVMEIKDFNDNLSSLFPDLKAKTSETLRGDIDESVEVRSLMLLQQASADGHEDISETASCRLGALGATAAAQSIISDGARTATEKEDPSFNLGMEDASGPEADDSKTDPEMDRLTKQVQAMEVFMEKKNEGALAIIIHGPHSYSARVTLSIWWDGQTERSPYFDDMDNNFFKLPHASHDEDYVSFDVESDPYYENKTSDTITVEGFALECWNYEAYFGKPRERTVVTSYAKMPNVPAKKLLRQSINYIAILADSFNNAEIVLTDKLLSTADVKNAGTPEEQA